MSTPLQVPPTGHRHKVPAVRSRIAGTFLHRLSERPRSTTYLLLFIFILDLLFIVLDDLAGPFVPFTVFYILLVYIAAAYGSARYSWFIAALSATGRTYVASQAFPAATYIFLALWQYGTSVSVYLLFCFLLNREISRRRQMQRALDGRGISDTSDSADDRRDAVSTRRRSYWILVGPVIFAVGALGVMYQRTTILSKYQLDPISGRIVQNPLWTKLTSVDDVSSTMP